MTKLHIAAAAFIGLSSLLAAPAAMASDFQQCREQAEEDCAIFWPPGTFQYATCVVNLTNICLEFGHLPAGAEAARLVDEAAVESCSS